MGQITAWRQMGVVHHLSFLSLISHSYSLSPLLLYYLLALSLLLLLLIIISSSSTTTTIKFCFQILSCSYLNLLLLPFFFFFWFFSPFHPGWASGCVASSCWLRLNHNNSTFVRTRTVERLVTYMSKYCQRENKSGVLYFFYCLLQVILRNNGQIHCRSCCILCI